MFANIPITTTIVNGTPIGVLYTHDDAVNQSASDVVSTGETHGIDQRDHQSLTEEADDVLN